ncbi:MAG: elongation factor Ts [Saprospiraceae bacterium]|nr:elongation factor Ts [Saprospiraceae bacterium]
MAVSIDDIKKLREMTGAGMGDCKKALENSGGDIEGAIDFLRKLGQKLSVKREDREAKEGVCIAVTSHNRNNGVVLRLSCETDFVAKNEKFVALAESFAAIALKHLPESREALLALQTEEGISIEDKVKEQIGVIGEKLEITDYDFIKTAAGKGQVLPYIHAGYRAAVIVALNQEGPDLIEAGKNVAMQVAAMKPVAVNESGVDAATVNREIEIGKEQARAEGKPEAMIEKIAQGKLQRFYKDFTLLKQDYVKDGSKNVAAYLDSVSKGLTVTDFKHAKLG